MSLFAFRFQSPGSILFEIGPVAVRWYGFLIAMAVIVGLLIAQNLAKRKNIDPEMISDLVLWLVIGALPCARIYYVLFEWERYARRPGDMIAIWQGGIAIHGAIIGGTIATILFAKVKKQSFWALMDVVMPSLILGQAIGRWGNFFNSEAFGVPTSLPWGLYIPSNRRPAEFLQFEYFHPTFLYESVWNGLVFVLLMALFFWGLRRKNNLKTGTLVFVYLISYSVGRLWIEGFRTDSLMLGDWRVAQIISVSAIALGLFGLFWLYIAKRPLPFKFDQETQKNISH